MLFPQRLWAGIEGGSVTVAFRRWKRASVKVGGTLQSPGGLLSIDEITAIEPDDISDDDAVRAGHADRHEASAALRPEGQLVRVRFHRIGGDPRIELRQRTDLDADELDRVLRALARLDWATTTLRLIAANPGTVSTELAPQLGLERLPFKQRVRRLKTLGLTESLKVGYRLSPRGETVLAHLDGRG